MKTSLGKGAIYLSISSIALMLAGYIINIFIGRNLGPIGYGTYGIVISLMTAANLMQTAGLPQAVSKFSAENESNAESVLKSGLLIQVLSTIILSLLFFLLAKPLALILKDLELINYIRMTSLIFPFYGIFALYTGYYNGIHKFKIQSLLNILYASIKVILVIILVYFYHLIGAILGFILSPLLALLAGFRIPKKTITKFPYKKLILFSVPLIGLAIFGNLLQSIDLFFVKAILHKNSYSGFYTANQNIAEIPFFGVTSLAAVLFPSISRSVNKKLENHTKNLISKSLRFASILLIPSLFIISATSIQILTLLYSSSFQFGSNSLSILVFGNGFFTLFTILTMIISGSGSPGKSSLLAGVGVILSSLFCLMLIPLYGLNGAAVATTIAAFIVMVGAAFIVYRKFNVLFSVKSTIKILAASLIIYFIARIIVLPLFLLPLWYVILFGIYIGLLFILKEITQEDMHLAKSLMPGWIVKKR